MQNDAKITIEKVPLPRGSLVAALPFTDHADAFCARVELARFPDVDAFARAFLSQKPPAWIRAAMKTRDAVVGTLLGLKTMPPGVDLMGSGALSGPLDPKVGARFGIFKFYERTASEILVGEDDRHLDFRVSLLHERSGDDALVTMSTVVRFENALGRAYFFPVRPVHGLVVPAMLRRALRQPQGSTISSNVP